MKLYKITNENDITCETCRWGEGVEHTADGKGKICSEHWLHAYTDPLVAVLMNPVHGEYEPFNFWEAEGDVGVDAGMKVGCTRLKTIRRIDAPEVTTEQRVRFGILCALEVYRAKTFRKFPLFFPLGKPAFKGWAKDWLSGKDRSEEAASAMERAAAETAGARCVTMDAATRAAESASEAARAAESAAKATSAAASAIVWAADAAVWKTRVVGAMTEAARQAARAAENAAGSAYMAGHGKKIDFIALAERAVKEEAE